MGDVATPNEALATSALLDAFTIEQLRELALHSRLASFGREEVLWLNGAAAPFFGLVVEGYVKLVKTNGEHESTLEIMGPGQTLGLLGAITGAGCPLMAVGLSDGRFLRIPKTVFLEQYGKSQPMQARLAEQTARRMHQKLDYMAKLANGSAEERVAAILLELLDAYSDAEMRFIEIPLTRQQLAEMTGTRTETVIRVLSRWTKEGLIRTANRRITVLKPNAVKAILSA